MSASPSRSPITTSPKPLSPKSRGFLHIARHGGGPSAIYIVNYYRLDHAKTVSKPALAEGAQALIELLERIGVDFHLREVRDALQDILRLGSANIPDLWLSDEEMVLRQFRAATADGAGAAGAR